MSLISGVWSQRTAEAIQAVLFSDIPLADRKFNGGTPADLLGRALVAPQASGYNPEVYVAGLPYVHDIGIVIDDVDPITGYASGLPLTPRGLAVEFNGVPASYVAGIPLSASGRVCLDIVAPLNLHAFDSGFDQGAFN